MAQSSCFGLPIIDGASPVQSILGTNTLDKAGSQLLYKQGPIFLLLVYLLTGVCVFYMFVGNSVMEGHECIDWDGNDKVEIKCPRKSIHIKCGWVCLFIWIIFVTKI